MGSAEGVIHHLEMLLDHPLHRNKLPFCSVFYKYNGKPSGHENWRSPIRKQIKEPLPEISVVEFHGINFNDFPVQNEEVD